MVAEKSTTASDEDAVLVAVCEAESAAAEDPFPAEITEPPTDRTVPARYLVAACSDVAAIAVGTVGAVLRVPARLTPVELAPVMAFVQDILRLGPGEGVPADCRLLAADGLEIDESALTGEALPVAKAPYRRGR